MIRFLIFALTINLFAISSSIDSIFEHRNIKKENSSKKTIEKVKSLKGTWITDSHLTVEIIKEDGYYIGIVKTDPYDSTSTFLNGEAILRFSTNLNDTNKGRLKIYNEDKGHKEWVDTNFKVTKDTIFDGYNLYKKVLDSKLKIKKKRINKKNIRLRIKATKQLKSSDWKQRLEGIKTITDLNDYSTIPQLTPLLFDQNDSVRKAAYYLLKKFNEENSIAGLSQLLEDSKKMTNSKKKKINNVPLEGVWTTQDNTLQIYLGTDNVITISDNGKVEKGLYISDGESQLAVQLDNDSEQVMLKYKITGDILHLKSPKYKNEIILKKLK